ncbi:MAG: GTPase Era [Campylobacterales bacterium]|nr:GTPase Era [Campylobacterales bacterium]
MIPTTENTKAGFVAVIGRPNVGKSTLVNALVGERIAMVSHKANATRKRSQIIVMHNNAQIIFVDTPGLHEKEKELNQFMLNEALKALGDADLIIFLADIKDKTTDYEKFLELNKKNIPHLLLLNKMDRIDQKRTFEELKKYENFSDKYKELVPLSAEKKRNLHTLLNQIAKHLPKSPYLYDPEQITTETIRDIYKELIREALFNQISDEIPYESDVIINSIDESGKKDFVNATIYVEKSSQKGIVIGKGGEAIKRIGINARKAMEQFSQKKIHLDLFVKHSKGWSKSKKIMSDMGYNVE